jgi:hypothetical protein
MLSSTLMTLKAQNTIGIHIGSASNSVSLNGLSDIVTPDISTYTGFSGGVDVKLKMDQNFNFKTGLDYRQKGFNSNIGTSIDAGIIDLPIGASANVRVNYIDVPVNLEYNIVNTDKMKVYAFAGPYAAYALNGHIQTKANLLISLNVKRFDINMKSQDYNRFELGANAGGGIETKIGNGSVFGDVSYQHGFSNQMTNGIIDLESKNRSINIAVGYRFNI